MAKNGVIQDVLAGLQKKLGLDDDAIQAARVFTVQSGRLQKELSLDYPVSSIPDYITLFAERIPDEELSIRDEERPIDAFHFDKDPAKTHGVPFKFYIVPVSVPTLHSILSITDNCAGRSLQGFKEMVIETDWH